jgi:hypothetical protein
VEGYRRDAGSNPAGLDQLLIWELIREIIQPKKRRIMITDFELQTGEGTNVEIIGTGDDELHLIIDEDTLVDMIRMAFSCPKFTVDHLIDALRAACPQGPEEDHVINDAIETDRARALRLAVVQQQYNVGNLTLDEAREILSGPLTPGDESTIYDDSDQLKQAS